MQRITLSNHILHSKLPFDVMVVSEGEGQILRGSDTMTLDGNKRYFIHVSPNTGLNIQRMQDSRHQRLTLNDGKTSFQSGGVIMEINNGTIKWQPKSWVPTQQTTSSSLHAL